MNAEKAKHVQIVFWVVKVKQFHKCYWIKMHIESRDGKQKWTFTVQKNKSLPIVTCSLFWLAQLIFYPSWPIRTRLFHITWEFYRFYIHHSVWIFVSAMTEIQNKMTDMLTEIQNQKSTVRRYTTVTSLAI